MQLALKHAYVLTGAMGAGKTSLLQELQRRAITCVEEPARLIIRQQRSIQGAGIYEQDPRLFVELMLSHALLTYEQAALQQERVLFDRGIPDCLAYAEGLAFDQRHLQQAAQQYRYNQTVFWLPAWPEIYTNDAERKMTYSQAKHFGERLQALYLELGYDVMLVPCLPVKQRADFILAHLK